MATPMKTIATYQLDGSTREFAIPFQYLARRFIVVTLIGETDRVLVMGTDYRFATKTTLSLTQAWGGNEGYNRIEIRRVTSATDRVVDFSDGSILRAYDLNTSQLQALHVAEEGREQTAELAKGYAEDADRSAQESAASADSSLNSLNGVLEAIANAGDRSMAIALISDDVTKGDALIRVRSTLDGASSRTQHDKNADVVSVRDLNVKGDGVSDDTAALTRAFANGGHFHMPKGVYMVSSAVPIPSGTTITGDGVSATIIRMKPNVDRVHHTLVSSNALSLDARNATDENVGQLIGFYVEDIKISELTVDGNWQNRPATGAWQDREAGTNIELHSVRRAQVVNVLSINAPQHCLNVRAGTISFKKGHTYQAPMPSQYVLFDNVVTRDQLFDDGITTHDSEFILVNNCRTEMLINASMPSREATSNGIEIDDGSRYVVVQNCHSIGSFGGYQAKGHTQTPPAHHIWFVNCIAENNHQSFNVSGVDTVNADIYSVEGCAHHVYLIDCVSKDPYVMTNTSAWAGQAHYIQIYNTRHLNIKNFSIVFTGKLPANAAAVQRVHFRTRVTNAFLTIDGLTASGVDDRLADVVGTGLFSVESNTSYFTLANVFIDKLTRNLVFSNSGGIGWDVHHVHIGQASPSYSVIRLGGVGGGNLKIRDVYAKDAKSNFEAANALMDSFDHMTPNRRMMSGEALNYTILASVPAGVAFNGEAINLDYTIRSTAGKNTRVGRAGVALDVGTSGGTDIDGRWQLSLIRSGFDVAGRVLSIMPDILYAESDNTMSLGRTSNRFKEIHAGNGAIITSDEFLKQDIVELDEAEVRVAKRLKTLVRRYKMRDAVSEKGVDARYHFGVIAQEVVDAFTMEGLKALDYGVVCYDEWDEEWEEVYAEESVTDEETGEVTLVERATGEKRMVRKADNRWGVRYDELFCFILAGL